MKLYIDENYGFYELFNQENGTLIRSNIKGTHIDPIIRSFPELIDIGIMGKCEAGKNGVCSKAGIDCYQDGANSARENMSFHEYYWIIKQCQNKVFQVALGGAGDPNKHKDFKRILSITREFGIIPNLTTSGFLLTDNEIKLIKKYCGAVAVSFYSRLIDGKESNNSTISAIEQLITHKCLTNIHFVISNNTIDEAIKRLKYNIFPKGINAVIFLLYKPVGLGKKEKVLSADYKTNEFINLALSKHYPYKIGFDTCFSSALFKSKLIDVRSIDTCEAARFSMYIDSELNAYPCSFGLARNEYKCKLNPISIQDAWNSEQFNSFREHKKSKCVSCSNNKLCDNGCKLDLNIELCD